ncbi:MAG: glycerol-3-phosphate 1-O-acyltransferase PlsY [Alphaproteobacteria bacterium]
MSLSINFIFIILFYFIGSIPFALILPKLFGLGDIRNIGSGNVGATNVLRTGNKYLAFGVLCCDVLKGLIPFFLLNLFFDNIGLLHTIFLCHFAILGHIFPFWLKFKGGKGVATYIGFLFGINLFLGLSFITVWMMIALIARYSSLSSIVASLIAPIYFFINNNNHICIFLLYLFLIIILKHRENIKRLINRTENKIKLSK